MISGVLADAPLAGLMWGLIFVGPLLVPEYPAMLQSMGRHLALGLIAPAPLARFGRARLRQLSRHDWRTALGLTRWGTLSITSAWPAPFSAPGRRFHHDYRHAAGGTAGAHNLLYSQRDGKLPRRCLLPAPIRIAVGLICANVASCVRGRRILASWRYGSGIVLC